MGPYQVLPRWARVDLGAMAMKGCYIFPKAAALLEPYHQCLVSNPGYSLGGSYPFAEVQSVYSTAPADWAIFTVLHYSFCLYFWDEVLCTLFTFFGLLSSSLSPCLSQCFSHCMLRPWGHMIQWIKALVRSSDVPKECEFNTRWRQWRTFRGEINRR